MTITLDNILQLLATVGLTSAAVAGFVVWISKEWLTEKIRARIKSEYDEKLETHKAQLKAHGDIETERLKSQLSIAAAERQFQFAKLHERRGEVIAETYEALAKVLFTAADYVKVFEPAGGSTRDERRKKLADAGNEFGELFRTKKIFLPKTTAAQVEKIHREIWEAHIDFFYGVDSNVKGDIQLWVDVHGKVEKLGKVAMAELEDELRRLLGDNPTPSGGAEAPLAG